MGASNNYGEIIAEMCGMRVLYTFSPLIEPFPMDIIQRYLS